jgi:hypothetical protein
MSPSTLDMMTARRTALDAMADRSGPASGERPFGGIRVDLGPYLADDRPGKIPAGLVQTIADRLIRDDGTGGAGAAVVTGLSRYFDLPAARLFHEALFRHVWDQVRHRSGAESPGDHFKIKVGSTSDGAIPLELYGSLWSFKQLHMDRDALLFSHLYGPVAGFTGGSLLLADIRSYMRRHALRFDDLFDWSEESTPGSKPVLRAEHEQSVLDECGIDLGGLGADEVLFVNNFPSAGVLHGVTPVVVADRDGFVREFHRCSVKGVASC